METTPEEEQKPPAALDQIFKLIVIGDAAVGKSCLVLQFTDHHHKFRPEHDPTIGAESSSRVVTVDERTTKLHVVDTAGRSEFRRMTRSFCDGAAAAVVVYDVTRRETFEHAGGWLRVAAERAPENLTVVLVGNKCDAPPHERAVGVEEGRAFADEHGLVFVEASAKTNRNVEEVFLTAARIVSQKIQDGVIDESAKFGGMTLFGKKFCVGPDETLEERRRWWWWWLCCR